MTVVVPYQAYAEGVANGLVAPGFGAFMAALPGRRALAEGRLRRLGLRHDLEPPVVPALPLRLHGAAGAAAAAAAPAGGAAPARRLHRPARAGGCWCCRPCRWSLYALLLAPRFPATHDLHARRLPARALLHGLPVRLLDGHRCRHLGASWSGCARRALALALACVAPTSRCARWRWSLRLAAARAARALPVERASSAILGFAHRHLNRPWPWLRLGQRVGLPLVHAAPDADRRRRRRCWRRWRLGPVLEPLLLLGITVLGCWLLTDGLIRRVALAAAAVRAQAARSTTAAQAARPGAGLSGLWRMKAQTPSSADTGAGSASMAAESEASTMRPFCSTTARSVWASTLR